MMNCIMRTLCAPTGTFSTPFRALLVSALLMGLSGCSTLRKIIPPSSTTTTPGGVILTQAGDAAKPATVSTETQTKTVPLPAGTNIVFDEKLGTVTLQLSKDSALTETTKAETATAPQAFTPPAPPTPTELAAGANKARTWYFSAGLGLLGLLFIYRTHIKAGVICFAGAVAYPIVQNLIDDASAHLVLVAAIAGAVALFWAWHLIQDQQATTLPQPAAITTK